LALDEGKGATVAKWACDSFWAASFRSPSLTMW